jgi:hypothetical protein
LRTAHHVAMSTNARLPREGNMAMGYLGKLWCGRVLKMGRVVSINENASHLQVLWRSSVIVRVWGGVFKPNRHKVHVK